MRESLSDSALPEVPMPNRQLRRHPKPLPSSLAVTTQDLIRRQKLWSPKDAAAMLDVAKSTLYRWEDEGLIVFVRVGGRTFVTDAELDRFVARAEAAS